jgi:hypothetical protein
MEVISHNEFDIDSNGVVSEEEAFIIYVLFKIKLHKKKYLLLVHCLFERYVNILDVCQ